MYLSIEGLIECVGCTLGEGAIVLFLKRSDAIEHLNKHSRGGDKVPWYAIERLKKELREEGDKIDLKKKGDL
jgi:hypothetical protein